MGRDCRSFQRDVGSQVDEHLLPTEWLVELAEQEARMAENRKPWEALR